MPNMIAPAQMAMAKPGTTDPAYLRKKLLSHHLMSDATSFRPAHSWGEALARALEGGVVGVSQAMDDRRARERDDSYQRDLAAALGGAGKSAAPGAQPLNMAQAFGSSENRDVRALGPVFALQDQMAAAKAAARKPVYDASGKHVIGTMTDEGKVEYVPSYALSPDLQAEQARVKAQATLPFDIAKAQAGRPQVDVRVEEKGRGEMAVLGAKAFEAAQAAARDADKRARMLDAFEQVSTGFQTGATAEMRLRAKQVAKDVFGLDIGDGDVAAGEALRALGRQLELSAAPRGQGQITEFERTIIVEQMPRILNTPGGNRLIISAMRSLDDYDRKVAQVYRENARRNGGIINPVEVSEEISRLGPALPVNIYSALTKGAQSSAPAAAAAPQQRQPGRTADDFKRMTDDEILRELGVRK